VLKRSSKFDIIVRAAQCPLIVTKKLIYFHDKKRYILKVNTQKVSKCSTVFTADIPQSSNTLLAATYADDTAILSSTPNLILASAALQDHANKTDEWVKKWKIKINTEKSVQVTFTLKQSPRECPQLIVNNAPIPVQTEIKYLGITLDKILTWGPPPKRKKKIVEQ